MTTTMIRTSEQFAKQITAIAWDRGVSVAVLVDEMFGEKIAEKYRQLPRAIRSRTRRLAKKQTATATKTRC